MKILINSNDKIIITTSLLSRGMDIKNVILVFNYDCPSYAEDFIHWVGRTGRGKEKGFSVTLMTE